jgi:hypothetical protein
MTNRKENQTDPELVNIEDVNIRGDLPRRERIADFRHQIHADDSGQLTFRAGGIKRAKIILY